MLAERSGQHDLGIRTIELTSAADLVKYVGEALPTREFLPLDHSTEKWTKYFLSGAEVGLLREIRKSPQISVLGDQAEVEMGCYGQNDFFVLSDSEVVDSGLKAYTRPIVTRSAHLTGLAFTQRDWTSLRKADLPVHLLDAPNVDRAALPSEAKSYVAAGEKLGFQRGYKCSIRKRWYIVPSVSVSDAFMLRQVHAFPKLILNQTKATCTDTIHRVRFKSGVNGKHAVMAFMNSMTLAFSEITGRSYGGGVMTFEPTEAERLPLSLQSVDQLDFDELDESIRQGDVKAVLDEVDRIILRRGLGLRQKDITALRGIWMKMKDRHIGRKRKSKAAPLDPTIGHA